MAKASERGGFFQQCCYAICCFSGGEIAPEIEDPSLSLASVDMLDIDVNDYYGKPLHLERTQSRQNGHESSEPIAVEAEKAVAVAEGKPVGIAQPVTSAVKHAGAAAQSVKDEPSLGKVSLAPSISVRQAEARAQSIQDELEYLSKIDTTQVASSIAVEQAEVAAQSVKDKLDSLDKVSTTQVAPSISAGQAEAVAQRVKDELDSLGQVSTSQEAPILAVEKAKVAAQGVNDELDSLGKVSTTQEAPILAVEQAEAVAQSIEDEIESLAQVGVASSITVQREALTPKGVKNAVGRRIAVSTPATCGSVMEELDALAKAGSKQMERSLAQELKALANTPVPTRRGATELDRAEKAPDFVDI